MSYNSKIDKLVDTALGEMQPGLMAKVSVWLEITVSFTLVSYCQSI